MTIIDQIFRLGREKSAHPALVAARLGAADEVVSYGDLCRRVESRALTMRQTGLKDGARCGLLARQGIEFVENALAILAAGACVAPLPLDAPRESLREMVERCSLHHVWRAETGTLDTLAAPPPVDANGDRDYRAIDPAYIRFTSGTTSARKGVLLGHAAIEQRLSAANAALNIGPEDRILWVLPMVHHFVVSILLYLRHGATILLPASSMSDAISDVAQRHGATVSYASPYHYSLLAAADSARDMKERLRLAVSTTAALTENVAAAFERSFGHPLCQALGIIEVGLPVINIRNARQHPTALGNPLPAYDVWLRDEEGHPVESAGEQTVAGEICIRGPGLFDAYIDPWIPARQVLEPDGFRTGDVGRFDADRTLYLLGRRRNRINVAGIKFFAEEVERVLLQHSAVRACRVFAVPHTHLGEIPEAEIALAEGVRELPTADIKKLCKEKLDGFKVPRRFHQVEAITATITGKVQRWS